MTTVDVSTNPGRVPSRIPSVRPHTVPCGSIKLARLTPYSLLLRPCDSDGLSASPPEPLVWLCASPDASPLDCCDSFFFPPRKLSRVPRALSETGCAADASSTTAALLLEFRTLGGEAGLSATGDCRRHVGVDVALSRGGAGVKMAISGAKVDSKSMTPSY